MTWTGTNSNQGRWPCRVSETPSFFCRIKILASRQENQTCSEPDGTGPFGSFGVLGVVQVSELPGSSLPPEERKRSRTKLKVAIALLLVAIAIGSGVIVSQQIFSTHPLPLPAPGISTSCSTLSLLSSSLLTNNTGTFVRAGTSGSILFRCGAEAQAFTSNGGGPVTPTFTLPAPYTTLTIVHHDPQATDCPSQAGISLTSGTPVSLARGNYDYCTSFANPPSTGLPQFTVTWSQ